MPTARRPGRIGRAAAAALAVAAGAIVASAAWRAETAPGSSLPGWFGPARLARIAGRTGRAPDDLALARGAAAMEPLDWRPFLLAGRVRLAAGDRRQAGPLLRAALRRDPRALPVRAALLSLAVANGDVGAALEQVSVLRGLDAEMADAALFRLASAMRTPADADQLAAAMQPFPTLFVPLLRQMVAANRSAAVQRRFVQDLPASAARNAEATAFVIGRLVAVGDYPGAYRWWTGGRPGPPSPVRDGRFGRPTLPPPFGWDLVQGTAGAAARGTGGGLDLVGYGREEGELARQLLLLPPGRYAVRAGVRGDGAPFRLGLRCVNGRPLGDGPPGAADLMVDVPALACPAQWLALGTGSGDGGEGQSSLHLDWVTVRPVGHVR